MAGWQQQRSLSPIRNRLCPYCPKRVDRMDTHLLTQHKGTGCGILERWALRMEMLYGSPSPRRQRLGEELGLPDATYYYGRRRTERAAR